MCRVVKCNKCQKPGWAGCGAHVEQVLGHVPKSARCACRETSPATSASKSAGLVGAIRSFFRK
jgi:hypothetical protein